MCGQSGSPEICLQPIPQLSACIGFADILHNLRKRSYLQWVKNNVGGAGNEDSDTA